MALKANMGLCMPKNKALHKTFKANCWKKTNTAVLFPLAGELFEDQTKYNATAIKKKSAVHTGANIQLGGLKLGFCKVAYQEPIAGVVKNDPIIPAPSHKTTANKNFKILFFISNISQCQTYV